MENLLNRFTAFLATTSLLWSCSNTVQNSNLKTKKLNGKVKSVRQYSYDSSKTNSGEAALVMPVTVTTYNREGNDQEYIVFNSDGSINSTINTSYYEN